MVFLRFRCVKKWSSFVVLKKMVAVSKNDRRQSVAVVSVSLCPCVPVGFSV